MLRYSSDVENPLDTPTVLRNQALKDKTPTDDTPSGLIDRIRVYGEKMANNIDPLNLYARLKDYYKGIEIATPWIADWITKSSLKQTEKKEFTRKDLDNAENLKDAVWQMAQKSKTTTDIDKLKTDVAGDTAFTLVMRGLSSFSGWAEKNQVERVYGKLAEIEFGKTEKELKFTDLKRSKNPMLREAAEYYGRKSFLRSAADWFGLIRLIPLAVYSGQNKWQKDTSKHYINNTDKGVGKFLNGIAKFGDGIKFLMFAKTGFFQWYFGSRQTGSFYEVKEIWNITEGISTSPNRARNENRLPGEFVTRQQIATLYERFREENPDMNMEQFTPDDPLTSRVFEQTARYLNHTYMPKLFKISEPGKQYDLPSKRFTHAMMVELVGSGGLRVEDAIGSSLKLEVLAYHGSHGVQDGIAKYREVSKVLEKINRPTRDQYASQEEAIQAVHQYLSQIDKLGREYLGEYWPPKYVNEELKEGFIKTIFQNADLSQEKFDYMASAMFMRVDNNAGRKFELNERDPASALVDTPQENAQEAQREAVQRERKSFTENITRKRVEDVMEAQTSEAPSTPQQPQL